MLQSVYNASTNLTIQPSTLSFSSSSTASFTVRAALVPGCYAINFTVTGPHNTSFYRTQPQVRVGLCKMTTAQLCNISIYPHTAT